LLASLAYLEEFVVHLSGEARKMNHFPLFCELSELKTKFVTQHLKKNNPEFTIQEIRGYFFKAIKKLEYPDYILTEMFSGSCAAMIHNSV
jgi:hypothetical protein